MNIIDAIDDPVLYEPWFRGPTWSAWHAVLRAAFALPLTDAELEFFRTVAERDPPPQRVRELWIVAGRRSGKDSIASVLVSHLASMFDEHHRLRPGERALVACLASDRDQARIVLNFTRSYFTEIDLLRGMVRRDTATGFELNNGVDIAVSTNSFRAVRGRPILAAILDEVAFWRSEDSANPDEEVYNALRPGMASLATSMLIGISSPYRRSGLLHKRYRAHFGKETPDVLVIKAPTRALNPTIPQEIIDRAMEEDPAAASAEWLGEFRNDLADFVSREAVEECVATGVRERPPISGTEYTAFVDPSGGSADGMTLAIAHKEDAAAVIDVTREVRPPFSPESVVQEFAELLLRYRVREVTGDRYGGEWPRERFRNAGITYKVSELTKSDLYRELLPRINSRTVLLTDNVRVVSQIAGLERRTSRTGKDSIDHAPGAHDDLANAVAGATWLADGRTYEVPTAAFGTWGRAQSRLW